MFFLTFHLHNHYRQWTKVSFSCDKHGIITKSYIINNLKAISLSDSDTNLIWSKSYSLSKTGLI